MAAEIARILREETVRDKQTGLAAAATPGDIGILFRSRASHREFERALEARGIPTYVYKGLGFFDADEIKDLSRADSLPRQPVVRPARGGVPALPLRPPVGRRRSRCWRRGSPRRLTDPDPRRARRLARRRDRAALELARRHVPAGSRGSIAFRPPI